MKKNDYILLISVIFYSFLLYKQLPGINFLIFNILLLGFLLWRNIRLLKNINWIAAATGSLATAFCIVWHGNFLSLFGNIISLSIISGLSFNTRSSLLFSILFTVYSYFSSIVYMVLAYVDKRRKAENERPENSTPYLKLLIIGLPFVIFLIFFFMYREANPVFNNFAGKLNLDFISFDWIRFTLGGIVLMYGFWYHKEIPVLAVKDATASNTIREEQLGQPSFLGKILGLANENLSGIILLSLLNFLLLTVNILDIQFLFLGGKLPEGLSYSDSVHQGIGMLITSIVFAVLIILYYFRGNLNFFENNKTLKLLAYLWVIQNAFMIISTAYRNNLYIAEYSLTYKRIGVYIYLLLALIGLATTFIKIAKVKSNWFLFRKNAWMFYTVLVISCFIGWDMLITNFNINRAIKNDKYLDKEYLLNLSYINIPLLLQISDTTTSFQSSFKYIQETYPENNEIMDNYNTGKNVIPAAEQFRSEIYNKIYNFKYKQQQTDWRSWSYDRAKTEKKLQLLIKNQDPESINLSSNNYTTLEPFNDFKSIKRLNFSNNKLSDISSLKHFSALEKLNLESNKLDSLTGLPLLQKLVSLNISNNAFDDLKPLKNTPKLEELIIAYNQNPELVLDFTLLPHLKSLDISGNYITNLAQLKFLVKLEKLVINGNADQMLQNIPELLNIRILHINGSNIGSDNFDLRNKIKLFKNLRELDISNNNIVFFNYFNDNYKTFQEFLQDKHDIKTKNFTPILPDIEVLNLSSNKLNNINGIGALKKLKILNLQKNSIDSLNQLSELQELKVLDISYNNFSVIEPLKNLKQLESLDLSHNNFSINEGIFATHQKLWKLNLAYSAIGSVKAISDAPAIKELNISYNNLTTIDGIERMQSLEILNLSGNKISDFSPLLKLKKLNVLILDNITEEQRVEINKSLPKTKIIIQNN